MKTPSKRTERHGQLRALTVQHLQSLTSEDLKQLVRFAERRMGALPQAGSTAEDAVQKAVAAIVRGTEKSEEGRRPRSIDLKSKATFMHFARSAINSVSQEMKFELVANSSLVVALSKENDASESPSAAGQQRAKIRTRKTPTDILGYYLRACVSDIAGRCFSLQKTVEKVPAKLPAD